MFFRRTRGRRRTARGRDRHQDHQRGADHDPGVVTHLLATGAGRSRQCCGHRPPPVLLLRVQRQRAPWRQAPPVSPRLQWPRCRRYRQRRPQQGQRCKMRFIAISLLGASSPVSPVRIQITGTQGKTKICRHRSCRCWPFLDRPMTWSTMSSRTAASIFTWAGSRLTRGATVQLGGPSGGQPA